MSNDTANSSSTGEDLLKPSSEVALFINPNYESLSSSSEPAPVASKCAGEENLLLTKECSAEPSRAIYCSYSTNRHSKFSETFCTSACRKFCQEKIEIQTSMQKKPFEEMTLQQIGYDSKQTPDWHNLKQTKKANLLQLLEKMIKESNNTNLEIKIEDSIFNCHLLVLKCYSEWFQELTDIHTITLPSNKVTKAAFASIYDWILTEDARVNWAGILELFIAAQFLKIKELENQCWLCLNSEHSIEDVAFVLYLEARKHNHKMIMQLMLARINKFCLTLIASEEYLHLNCDEVCTLLRSNSISVNSENEILMAGILWLWFDWSERENYLLEIMACVRFGLMAPWQLVALLNNCSGSEEIESVVRVPEVQKMINDGLSYTTMKFYYSPNSENLIKLIQRLNITEPIERQWIRDKMWMEKVGCANTMMTSYQSFLEYLEFLRKKGPKHWVSLTSCEGNPNLVLQKQNRSNNLNVIGDGKELK